MKIVNIQINNFKSIKNTEISPSEFNVNVGQNNHGKTNYFEALRWFFDGYDRDEILDDIRCAIDGTEGPTEVKITFTGVQQKIANMDSVKAKNLKNTLKDNDNIVIRRNSENGKKRELFNPQNNEWEDPMGADKTWNEFLPTFEYVHTKQSLHEVDAYKNSSPIGQMLSGVLTSIIENDPNYKDFRDKFNELFEDDKSKIRTELNSLGKKVGTYLEKQFPDGTTVRFAVENPQFDDLLKNFQTKINDGGIETNASDKGDGMQRAVMLSIIQAYADYRRENGINNSFIFLIDEAELHLHPSAQRALKSALSDIATEGDQVFINTHSSVFIADDSENQKIFSVKKVNGLSDIQFVDEQDKPAIVFDLLGGSPTDLLLPANILIVEGFSEVKFLRGIVKRFYSEKFSQIQIVPANGDVSKQNKSIKFIDLAYECFKSESNPYSSKVIVIADGPSTSNKLDYEKFKKSNPELVSTNRFFELPIGSIEEYYPDPYAQNPSTLAGTIGRKDEYAQEVAAKITQKEFEEKMVIVFEALVAAKSLSFGDK
ncbi:MAG TPA: AAA family ATPase [Candidatus Saccharimonadales bacterium]|nr:AAA family ATPase [Candidatus Saccharimonadales bacterium]